tara:strand:+ start:1498 stop:2352 length:855 start_codon:yes stop_codon:yes gene_type:complete
MNNLKKIDRYDLQNSEDAEKVEAAMLSLPQADCPVVHRFAPGLYIRELTVPAGVFVVGHHQKNRNLNIVLTGKFLMEVGGEMKEMSAPLFFVAEPGRKSGYALETVVWQNIYATEETDIDKIEEMIFDKSKSWSDHKKENDMLLSGFRETDREDYRAALKEFGVTEETARSISESQCDQMPMPDEWAGATAVRESNIEGKGLFLTWPVPAETIISPARINGKRTPAGRYVNHSANPNCKYVMLFDSDIYLVAKSNIHGCQGGGKGEELTVDYRQAVSLNLSGEK